MIYEVLNFLKRNLESFLLEGRHNAEPLLLLSNPFTNNDSTQNSTFLNSITLINIEEEKTFMTQNPKVVQGKNGGYFKREPDIKLNLYILISAYNKNYEDGLKFISKVVGFYQRNNVFQNNPLDVALSDDLPDGVEKIIMELYTANFDQQNQIWASLSTGYIPSVIYKVRMISIDTDTMEKPELPFIQGRDLNLSKK